MPRAALAVHEAEAAHAPGRGAALAAAAAAQAVPKVDRECSPRAIIAISEQVCLSKSQLVR